MRIKNDCWKEQKGQNVDFVIVSDLDEIIWAKDLNERLQFAKDNKIAVPRPRGYDFVSQTFPEYRENELLHNQIKTCTKWEFWDKPICFQPDLVEEINYTPGGHCAVPVSEGTYQYIDDLFLFHFKYLSSEYLVSKRFATAVRMSEINKEKGWGVEYLYDRLGIESQFNGRWDMAKNFSVENLLKTED